MVEVQWRDSSFRLSTSWLCGTVHPNAAYYCQAWIEIEPRQREESRHFAIGRFDLAGYVSICRTADQECHSATGGDYSVSVGGDCVTYAVASQVFNGFDLDL